MRTARDRRSQSVSCVEHAFGRRPRLAPEAILGDAAARAAAARARLRAATAAARGSSAARATGSATSGGDSTPRIWPREPRERLQEVQVRDHRRDTRAGCPRQRVRRPSAARRRRSWRSSRRCRRRPCRAAAPPPTRDRRSPRRPAPASVSTIESTCHRTECGQERERVDVGAVDRRKRRRAPDAGVDARRPTASARTAAGCRCGRATASGRRGTSPGGAPSASVSPSP